MSILLIKIIAYVVGFILGWLTLGSIAYVSNRKAIAKFRAEGTVHGSAFSLICLWPGIYLATSYK